MMMETTMSRSLRLMFSGAAAIGIGMLAQPVMAQEATTSTAAPVQRVEITGSSIRRVDAETPSPVQVISAEDLKKSGYTSIAQVLQNVTANGSGTLSQGFSGAFASGAQGISLRGLTTSATLVLIDGHRIAANALFDDGQRSFVDISQIPFDAIERVEILKDGASAQYGSDAMAGVVNVILKKNFTGTTVSVEGGGTTEGGAATKHISVTSGFGDLETDGYNAFASVEYRHVGEITQASRADKSPGGGWTTLNWKKYGGTNLTPGTVTPQNPNPYIPGSTYLLDPNALSNSAANTAFLAGACNSWAKLSSGGCQFQPLGAVQPETSNLNLLASFTKRLSGDWQVAVKASVFESDVDVAPGTKPGFPGYYAPAIAGGPGINPYVVTYPIPPRDPNQPITVPGNFPGNTLGVPARVIGFDQSGPNVEQKIKSLNYRFAIDLTGTIGAWDTQTSFGTSKNTVSQDIVGTMNTQAMEAALNRPVNPYNILGKNAAIDTAAIYPDNVGRSKSTMSYLDFHASRSLAELPGGDLGFSAGASYTYTNIYSPPPNLYQQGEISGNQFLAFVAGEQSDTAVFAEIAAPVTKTLELDAHARFDRFGLSSSSSSFTPSFGFKWTPAKEFALRGTLATGFRAPNVAETGKSGQIYVGPGYDNVNCPGGAQATLAGPAKGSFLPACGAPAVFQTANPNLQPEKSVSATLGVILEPVKGWSSTFDVYDIKIKQQIFAPAANQTPVRSLTPVSGQCADGAGGATNCTVAGSATKGVELYIADQYQNANSTETRGWELESHYKWKLGTYGNLTTSVDWSHTMSYIQTIGGAALQLAGTHGPSIIGGDTGNPKDRIQASLTYDLGPWNVTVAENYVSGYNNTDPTQTVPVGLPNTCQAALNAYSGSQFGGSFPGNTTIPTQYCTVGSFLTTDLTARYKYSKQLEVHLAVNNLFNRQPPVDFNTYGGSPYLYNPSMHQSGAIGTFLQAGLAYHF